MLVPRPPPCKHYSQNNDAVCDCLFQAAQCYNCGKLGHIASVCHAAKKQRNKDSR